MMRGMGNMQGMMKQMQKMQKEMGETKAQLDQKEFTGEAGNGLVKVVMTGERKVINVVINPDVLDPEDADMTQDLVLAATNDFLEKIEVETEKMMGKYTKNIPGF
ncbi:YbaB/EbfC family nucleoid-associated protein [Vagococcus carniphilus]|uniref:YbaB/EbfC family nucleoid-associated protein n=1 Tax=Vagococcus carniphilus TaxID=218144 RepID=UPI00288D27B9|nr:YbaB/EbfC family nucleoid-associated protein [Vagococcus carniphilus]MDT2839383.1 YbaB/EbfC family nucleoid-associated protein [Vagococcus carniphilus]